MSFFYKIIKFKIQADPFLVTLTYYTVKIPVECIHLVLLPHFVSLKNEGINKRNVELHVWMDDLRIKILFNSISVISGRW